VNKIRYAPEVASRPDRLAKDLQNVKLLATILEDQAAELRAFKPPPASVSVPAGSSDQNGTAGPGEEGVVNGNPKAEEQDAEMTAPDQEGGGATVEEEEEPKERGSDAVERRIEKFISDMRDQGLVDVNDEKAFKEKKVGSGAFFFLSVYECSISFCHTGCSISRHVPRVFASCVSHMLLLRYRYRSS
jgi:hypothetical protein